MSTYKIEKQGDVLKVGFDNPAQNDQIVKDVQTRLEEMSSNGQLDGGSVIGINGPTSLPVGAVLTHYLSHRYGTVAMFDPKLQKYVVAVTHGGEYELGQLIDL